MCTQSSGFKAENLVKVIRSLEASAEALKTEKIRLQDRQKAVENNVKNLKEYLQFNMETLGKDKVRTELFNLNIQNNPPRLVVDDEKEIPKAYWEEQPAKLNKKMLLEDLKSSNNIDFKGAHIEQGRGLRIR